jgi:hypothetical protein
MTELATAWMLGCACGFFMSVTIARPPRDRDPDWRRSFNHENTTRPRRSRTRRRSDRLAHAA